MDGGAGPAGGVGAGRSGSFRRRTTDPQAYDRTVATVAEQLGRCRVPGTILVVPVVGFGEQAADVIGPTLQTLAGCATADTVVLALVNRPSGKAADSTFQRIRAWMQATPDAPVFAAQVVLDQRPRIGELRQLGLDAAEAAWGTLPDGAAVVLTDDDLVSVPPGTLASLERCVRVASLAIGPVLFDHHELPMCLLPDLYAGDLCRALLSDELLHRLERDPTMVSPRVIESLVLSGNYAVRRDALARVGGMRDLNELTGLARDVLFGASAGAIEDLARPVVLSPPIGEGDAIGTEPVERLRRLAVRVHSRRALAAYASAEAPTVAQWRECRLRSSSIDPVRVRAPEVVVPPPLDRLGSSRRSELVAGAGRHFAAVFDHLEPEPESARRTLEALGISRRDAVVEPPGTGHRGWHVRLRRTDGLIDRVAALQRLESADRERARVPLVRAESG